MKPYKCSKCNRGVRGLRRVPGARRVRKTFPNMPGFIYLDLDMCCVCGRSSTVTNRLIITPDGKKLPGPSDLAKLYG